MVFDHDASLIAARCGLWPEKTCNLEQSWEQPDVTTIEVIEPEPHDRLNERLLPVRPCRLAFTRVVLPIFVIAPKQTFGVKS